MESNHHQVVVVMVPFPMQSHLNTLLQLSRIISSHKIPVHYLASHLYISLIKSRAAISPPNPNPNPSPNPSEDLDVAKIRFHDFPFPPPDELSPFPDHASSLLNVRRSVETFIRSLGLTSARVVFVHDVLMSYCVPNDVESYSFTCVSAFSTLACLWEALGRESRSLKALIGPCKLPRDGHLISFVHSLLAQEQPARSGTGALYNTCSLIEGKFLEHLAKDKEIIGEQKLWAVGPLYSLPAMASGETRGFKCLEWLEKQEPSSVLYVSFGTSVTFSSEDLNELALGLERSGAKFLWVLRDADKKDLISVEDDNKPARLPLGFEERVERMGMGTVVREWVPQMEILGHSSTSGFMSHCGWNSCMESITMGVPIAAWPVESDQPWNSVLITELLGVGLIVREWEKRGSSVSSSMVKDAVERLMKSEEGEEIKRRAEELGCEVRKAMKDGVARKEWDSFVSHITRDI